MYMHKKNQKNQKKTVLLIIRGYVYHANIPFCYTPNGTGKKDK